MRKEYTFHSREEKLAIVKRYLSEESPKALGKELGISDGLIRKGAADCHKLVSILLA